MGAILELQFKNALGSSRTLRINQPKVGLTVAEVKSAQEAIAQSGAFEQEDSPLYVEPVGARYVKRVVDDIYQAE